MQMTEATKEDVKEWQKIFDEYRPKLKPNKRDGQEIIKFLISKYPTKELFDEKIKEIVAYNITNNDFPREKLPNGILPKIKAFAIVNKGTGKMLYENQDEVFKNTEIFVGIDQITACIHVEGSSFLYDELVAYAGMDEKDLTNIFVVAEYIKCLKRFNMLEKLIQENQQTK